MPLANSTFNNRVTQSGPLTVDALSQFVDVRDLGMIDSLLRDTGYWYSTLRPYIARAPSATLATGTPAHRFQGCYVHAPVAVWHCTIVPGWRLPSCCRCSWAATAFHSEPNMRRDADTQHLRRQSVRSCRPRTMEQSSIAPERCWLIVQWIPAVVKDISFLDSAATAQCELVLTAPSRNSLTYLLTYTPYGIVKRLRSGELGGWRAG